MKKLVFVAAVAALSVPAFAQSGGTVLTNPEFGNGFSNRGQCQSALAHVRNEQRRNPSTRGAGYQQLSESDFQRESLRTTRCEERNGRYVVVFYPNGF
jgi:NAD/NADP transhydrogenase alpha subunit